MNKLRRMEIFRAVVEARKFSQAAENLGLSKSAVSHAVSDLETYLGTQLINRDNRKFQLTSDGESYYEQCCHFLSELSLVERTYRRAKPDIDGLISITAPMSFGVKKLTPVLTEFLNQNPQAQISLSLSSHQVDLVQAGLDLAIRIGHLPSSALKARRLSSAKFILCASPAFAADHPEIKTLEDLKHLNLLRYRWTPKWNFTRSGKKHSLTPKGTITADSGAALLEFTAAGHGVSYLPDFIVEDYLAKGRVVSILPDYQGISIPVHAVFPPSRHRPARVKRLTDFLAQRLVS